jgi:AraC-like DNA-binding protein
VHYVLSESLYLASKMDPLSQIIGLLKPQAVAWRIFETHGACSLVFPTKELVAFGQMLEGVCEIELGNGTRASFAAGDFLLLAAPSEWKAHVGGGGPEVGLKELIADPGLLMSEASGREVLRFMAGAFEFAAPNADLIAELMPPLIHVRGAEVVGGRLGALLTLLEAEAMGARPGRSLVLDRLLEIILIEAIRLEAPEVAEARPGLLAGLHDPRIGAALGALHGAPQNDWTVEALARLAGMSRSSFASKFREKLGAPPLEYLLALRLNLAKSSLVSTKTPLARVAELAGYQSASAFSTAFRRATGLSPRDYARRSAQEA